MKKQRCFVALVGLFILFNCAVVSYTCENEKDMRNFVVRNDRITDELKENKLMNCAGDKKICASNQYGNTMIHVNAIDYRNGSNKRQKKKTKITPKKYLYRNPSRQLLLTKQDYLVLLRIVEAEATGGTEESKAMVANVVLNRVADEHFPNTVTDVVFQRGRNGVAQFSPITDGRFQKIEVTRETKNVVMQVLKGDDQSKGALFFLNPRTSAAANLQWFQGNLKYLFDCGGHSFYCYKNS